MTDKKALDKVRKTTDYYRDADGYLWRIKDHQSKKMKKAKKGKLRNDK